MPPVDAADETPSRAAIFEAKMRVYRDNFVGQLSAWSIEMDQIARDIDFVDVREAKPRLSYMVHNLAGMGATFGFGEISIVARALSQFKRDNPQAEFAALRPLIHDIVATCGSVIVAYRLEAARSQSI